MSLTGRDYDKRI